MKHSKLFLGATTCLLVIAGIAATKTAKFGATTVTYFTQVSILSNSCVTAHVLQPCAAFNCWNGNRCFYYTTGPDKTVTSFPLYTGVNAAARCIHPLCYLAN